MVQIHWGKAINAKDIAASKSYLTLVFNPKEIASAIRKLQKRKANVETFKAMDILRASGTLLLPEANEDVRAEFLRILKGTPLIPVSLVRKDHKLFIADGYHRTCAAYYLNKDSEVHCVLVGIE